MENLRQMTDRDDMEIYLDGLNKTQLTEMIIELNKNLGKYSYKLKKSITKNELKNILVEHFAFIAINKMIANRPNTNPFFH
jgi:23S rRNA U2552 (ribose-2'-O)-methylase RlmE/FtsJ